MDSGESGKEVFDREEEIDSDNEEENSSEDGDLENEDEDETQDGTDASSDEDGNDDNGDDDDDETEGISTATGDETIDDDDDSDAEDLEEKEMSVSRSEDPDMSCPICLNEFAGQDLGSPENCGHYFCLECIVEWSRNVNTCPIDRIEFHLIYMKQEINGIILKNIKVEVKKEEEEYVEEVTLCEVCHLGDREDRLLLCDSCDSGYHCECLDPPLETIPIEEWFCPPCLRVINRRAGRSCPSHSRLIARTSASETVRLRIQNHRIVNSEVSGSERARQVHATPSRTSRKKKSTRRKTRRKTTRKSSKPKTKARTKATAGGKSKAAKKSATKTHAKKRRKTKRRKTSKNKKKSRRSRLASVKLVAPSVKKRIADRLGLCKPPPGHTLPFVRKPSGPYSVVIEQTPSLDILGWRDQLFDFNENYNDCNINNPRPSTSKQQTQASNLRRPIAVASASRINLLDDILETQNFLLKKAKDIKIGKDGSLSMKEESHSIKIKNEIKNSSSKSNNDSSALEPNSRASSSVEVKQEMDTMLVLSSDEIEDKGASIVVSSVSVKREKRSPSPGPSVRTKIVKLEDTLSSFCGKKEAYLQPHVRFPDDAETIFSGEDSGKSDTYMQMSEFVEKKPRLSFASNSRKTVSKLERTVDIKKEKSSGLLSDCSIDAKHSVPSFHTNSQKDRKVSEVFGDEHHKDSSSYHLEQFLENTTANSSSVSEDIQNEKASAESKIVTKQLSTLYSASTVNSICTKDMLSFRNNCQKNGLIHKHVKTEESLISECRSYEKAQNDRKRHLPFLSNGMNNHFKIPKLSKHSEGDSASKTSKISHEVSCMPSLDINRLVKSEILIENYVSEDIDHVNTSNDSILQNTCQKCTGKECTCCIVAGPKDIDSCNQNDHSIRLTLDATENSLLNISKHNNTNELQEDPAMNSLKSESAVSSVPNTLKSKNNHLTDQDNTEDFVYLSLSSQNISSQISSPAMKSHYQQSDRKERHCSTNKLSDAVTVKNSKQRHLLSAPGVKLENKKAVLHVHKDSGHKSLHKTVEKVPSKTKLTENIVAEIKKNLKDFYVTDLITKEEYKEIMRRAVPKVLQNCRNSIDPQKIRKLVIQYVHLIGNSKPDCS